MSAGSRRDRAFIVRRFNVSANGEFGPAPKPTSLFGIDESDATPIHLAWRAPFTSAEEAREAGHEWVHVDFDDDVADFHYRTCGFTPTNGGLCYLPDER